MDPRAAEVDAVVAAIEAAFGSVSRGKVTLHEAEVIDHYATVAERQKARARDTEEDWRDVAHASIEACSNALPHLDPASWRFYLPAFMRCGLVRLTHRKSVMDRVIYSLALGDDRALNAYQKQRFSALDADQADAVRSFLAFAAKGDAWCDARVAKQALDMYWARSP